MRLTKARPHPSCHDLVVPEGADVNAYLEFGDYGSALAAAVLGPRHTVEIVQFLIEDRHADLTKMHVYQPRTIRRHECICTSRWYSCEVASYLMGQHQIEARSLISMGFEERGIEGY